MNYYDRIYGQVKLDPILGETIRLCPEIKRLRYVGMMNYRSLETLGLTSISRLEHVIGTAYLAQVFAYANNINYKNDLLVAALYHDVNCAPFGHAVEWAIDRYTSYKHEDRIDWILHEGDKTNTSMPKFFDENGLHRHNLKEKFELDLNLIAEIIQGKDKFIINNSGIDLDNVDNVYRMAACLGILGEERSYPELLAKNLRLHRGINNFVINEKYFYMLEHWHAIRSNVYNKFIYSKEYFAYEGLLFKLLAEYVKTRESDDLDVLWTMTDDILLSRLMERSYEHHKVYQLAKKLLLFDFDDVYFMLKTDDYVVKDQLTSNGILDNILLETINIYNNETKSKLTASDFYLHLTTDNKKTHRRVNIFVEDQSGNIGEQSIGHDKQSLVMGLLGKEQSVKTAILVSILIKVLEDSNLSSWKAIPFADEASESFEQFGLFKC